MISSSPSSALDAAAAELPDECAAAEAAAGFSRPVGSSAGRLGPGRTSLSSEESDPEDDDDDVLLYLLERRELRERRERLRFFRLLRLSLLLELRLEERELPDSEPDEEEEEVEGERFRLPRSDLSRLLLLPALRLNSRLSPSGLRLPLRLRDGLTLGLLVHTNGIGNRARSAARASR